MKGEEEKCCGCCCWFHGEDTYGYGVCPFQLMETMQCEQPCNKEDDFVSRELMRHYQAVLLQANRYRRDPNIPSIYRMPDPVELGKAIDFAIKYIKTHSIL